MAVTKIRVPNPVSLSSNNMWLEAKPNPLYANKPGYYIKFEITNSSTGAVIIPNNVKTYTTINGGNAVFDVHNVLKNYVSPSMLPLNGQTGVYVTGNGNCLFNYGVNVYEYSGATKLSSYPYFFLGICQLGASDRTEVDYSYVNYTMQSSVNKGKFLTPWVRTVDNGVATINRKVRVNDRGVMSWYGGGKAIVVFVTYDNGSTASYSYIIPTGGDFKNFGIGYYEINKTGFKSGVTVVPSGFNILNILRILLFDPSTFTWHYHYATQYRIRIINSALQTLSETIICDVDNDCTLKEEVQLMWLNKLGSWDSFTFFREERKYLNINKNTYLLNDYKYDGGLMKNVNYQRGTTVLSVDVTERYTVKSKVIDDVLSQNLAQMFESPEVYWIKDGVPLAVVIDSKDEEVQSNTNRPDRAIYTVNFYKANQNRTL